MKTVECRDCFGHGSVFMDGELWICIVCDGDGQVKVTEG